MREGDTRFYTYICGSLILFGWVLIGIVVFGCASKHVEPVTGLGATIGATDQAQRAVRIEIECGWKGSPPSGSGVIIDPYRILTAFHVPQVCEEGMLSAILADGSRVDLERHAALPSHDLAMLSSAIPMIAPQATTGRTRKGDTVCISPGTPSRDRQCGKVLIVFNRPGQLNLYHTVNTIKGNSGAGIYNAAGLLVGIATHSAHKGSVPMGGGGTALWLIKETE